MEIGKTKTIQSFLCHFQLNMPGKKKCLKLKFPNNQTNRTDTSGQQLDKESTIVGEFVIGRGSTSNFKLNSAKISKEHTIFSKVEDNWFVQDKRYFWKIEN